MRAASVDRQKAQVAVRLNRVLSRREFCGGKDFLIRAITKVLRRINI